MNIIIAILVFTVIVVLHELGHFLLAKKNGVGVIEFSVGMGPRLFTVVKTDHGMTARLAPSQKYCETREDWQGHTWYSWKLFPIGGSCMMVGEDEVNDAPDSFQRANVWGKIAIIAAGPIFNFISAFIFAVILVSFVGYNPPVVTYVGANSPAAVAGIKEGDRITAVNGEKIRIGGDFSIYLNVHKPSDAPYDITYVDSKGEEKTVQVSAKYSYYRLGFSYEQGEGAEAVVSAVEEGKSMDQAGIQVGDKIIAIDGNVMDSSQKMAKYIENHPFTEQVTAITYERDGQEKTVEVTPFYDTRTTFQISMGQRVKGSVLDTVKYGAIEIRFWIVNTIRSLGMIITGGVSKDDVSGVVGVVDMIGQTVDASRTVSDAMLNLLNIAILLSANLGVMNLLPFPALDGGRLVFLFLEAVRRKPVDQKIEGTVHLIGIVLLMALMVAVTFNDITRIVMR